MRRDAAALVFADMLVPADAAGVDSPPPGVTPGGVVQLGDSAAPPVVDDSDDAFIARTRELVVNTVAGGRARPRPETPAAPVAATAPAPEPTKTKPHNPSEYFESLPDDALLVWGDALENERIRRADLLAGDDEDDLGIEDDILADHGYGGDEDVS